MVDKLTAAFKVARTAEELFEPVDQLVLVDADVRTDFSPEEPDGNSDGLFERTATVSRAMTMSLFTREMPKR